MTAAAILRFTRVTRRDSRICLRPTPPVLLATITPKPADTGLLFSPHVIAIAIYHTFHWALSARIREITAYH